MKSFFYTLALVTTLAALCPAQLITSVASQCATSTDGTVVGTPNPLNPPQVSAVYTGTLPAGNYYVVESWYDALSNTTLVGPEVQIQLTGTGEIQEMPPTSGLPNTVSGRNIYISTASGTETLQGSAPVAATYVQSVPLVTGAAVPAVNSTVCQVIANDSGWPTGTGYSVDFTTTAGDTLPGYPMQWQLLGPGNTINLSSGLPLYNGTVTYPSPILASPYNHGTQSISGPLSLGNYPFTAGAITASSVDNIQYANQAPGATLDVQIQASDTALGAAPGQIWVTTSGTIAAPVTLSATHELVCVGDNVVLTMGAGAYIVESNGSRVRGCTLNSTQTTAPGGFGEIYSNGTVDVQVSNSIFIGGGPHIYYSGVSSFRISNTRHVGVTVGGTNTEASPIYITGSNNGQVNNPLFDPFIFPVGQFYNFRGGLVFVSQSTFVQVNGIIATNIDATQVNGGAGGISFAGGSYNQVHGGSISNTINMDSVLTQSATPTSGPPTDYIVDGLSSISNNNVAGVGSMNNLGSCLDFIVTARITVFNVSCINDGNLSTNRQPGVFLFLDDYVTIANSEFVQTGEHGVEVFGTPHTKLIGNDYTLNQSDGVLAYGQTGTVTVAAGGTNVTWTAGATGGFSLAWLPGTAINIGGTNSQIASVNSNTSITLSTAVSSGSGQAYYVTNYDTQVIGGSAMDNGTSGLGTYVYGVEAQTYSDVLVSGVTLGDDRASGSKTQIYGVNVSAFGSADLDNNDLNGGCPLCANATGPMAGVTLASLPNVSLAAGKRYFIQDSTTVSAEGQTCVGGSTHNAFAMSDGTTWKCF